jgi:tRNA(fMet)-specific endonuclease VapC
MTLVLDTDVLVDVLRAFPPAVAWLSAQAAFPIVPGYTALELYAGCKDANAAREVAGLLSDAEIRWATSRGSTEMLERYSAIRRKSGLGVVDALIAQTAIEAGATLLTFNTKHFSAVEGLVVEEPYER